MTLNASRHVRGEFVGAWRVQNFARLLSCILLPLPVTICFKGSYHVTLCLHLSAYPFPPDCQLPLPLFTSLFSITIQPLHRLSHSSISIRTTHLYLYIPPIIVTMDRLPQEITDSIVEAFVQDLEKAPPTRLSKYSTVSMGWRRAIERRIFTKIDGIASGSFQLSFFKNLLAGEGNKHRRDSVRSFTYTTYLAFRDQQDMADFVREGQLRLLDEFSQLFTVINDIWVSSPVPLPSHCFISYTSLCCHRIMPTNDRQPTRERTVPLHSHWR